MPNDADDVKGREVPTGVRAPVAAETDDALGSTGSGTISGPDGNGRGRGMGGDGGGMGGGMGAG